MFENEPLADAIAEMNGYSRVPVVLGGAQLGKLPISGVYVTGDNEAFARSVGVLFDLPVEVEDNRIIVGARSL